MAAVPEKEKLRRLNGPFGIGQQSQKCLMMIAREPENAGVVVSFCCSDETECDCDHSRGRSRSRARERAEHTGNAIVIANCDDATRGAWARGRRAAGHLDKSRQAAVAACVCGGTEHQWRSE
jgi:hypothetical protein